MEDAYLLASTGGTLPAAARQIYYAARPMILKMTGSTSLDSAYFTQKVLPDYVASHPKKTAEWDVTYDARGHFEVPHVRQIVPLGTLDVRRYLQEIATHGVSELTSNDIFPRALFPTRGPVNRISAVLYSGSSGSRMRGLEK